MAYNSTSSQVQIASLGSWVPGIRQSKQAEASDRQVCSPALQLPGSGSVGKSVSSPEAQLPNLWNGDNDDDNDNMLARISQG